MVTLDENLGQAYLEQFEKLDFSQGMEQRRTGMFLLENFYGTILMEVGRDALQCDNSIRNDGVHEQWEEIHGRLENTIDHYDLNKKELYEYKKLLKEDVRPIRNSIYHEFDRGISADTLQEMKDVGIEFREWLLDVAKKYRDLHGPYTKSEFNEIQGRIDHLTDTESYTSAVQLLREELDYATRSLLKEEGVTGPFWKPEGNVFVREKIDRQQMLSYRSVRLAERKDDLRPAQYEQIIEKGLSVLEAIYKSQNPFEDSQLSADDLADAISDEFNVISRNSAARYVIVEDQIEIDDEAVDAGLQVRPGEGSVFVSSIQVKDSPDLSESVRDTLEMNATSRWRDDDEGVVVWKLGMYSIDVDIDEIESEIESLMIR